MCFYRPSVRADDIDRAGCRASLLPILDLVRCCAKKGFLCFSRLFWLDESGPFDYDINRKIKVAEETDASRCAFYEG